MSEFECRNGHLMKSGSYTCEECGERLYKMDGMTNREIEARERDYERCEDMEDDNEED